MEQIDIHDEEWGLFPWFPDLGVDMIHPDDLEVVTKLQPYGKVLKVIEKRDDYIRLNYGELNFNVRPILFRQVETPPRVMGDEVMLSKNGAHVTGVVIDVLWHHKNESPFYLLSINGKSSSRRYWESDFLCSSIEEDDNSDNAEQKSVEDENSK